jgi:sterol desaturase/sphingolipid hydroxylase (fatty acid hydroxylase superfamily)
VSWASTFARFQPGRIPLLGPIVVLVADWSKPQPGHAIMFENAVLERLSLARPVAPAVAYTTAGLVTVWQASRAGLGWSWIVLAYAAGFLAWTLLEYLAHRVEFHHVPETEQQVAFGYVVHGVHHAFPDDSRHWMLPLVVTLPIATAVYIMLRLLFGAAPGGAAFAGFVHGYLTYDLLHYFIHRGRMPTRLGRYLRQYHLAHHFTAPDRHFGVSSPLWDHVFRTR